MSASVAVQYGFLMGIERRVQILYCPSEILQAETNVHVLHFNEHWADHFQDIFPDGADAGPFRTDEPILIAVELTENPGYSFHVELLYYLLRVLVYRRLLLLSWYRFIYFWHLVEIIMDLWTFRRPIRRFTIHARPEQLLSWLVHFLSRLLFLR